MERALWYWWQSIRHASKWYLANSFFCSNSPSCPVISVAKLSSIKGSIPPPRVVAGGSDSVRNPVVNVVVQRLRAVGGPYVLNGAAILYCKGRPRFWFSSSARRAARNEAAHYADTRSADGEGVYGKQSRIQFTRHQFVDGFAYIFLYGSLRKMRRYSSC